MYHQDMALTTEQRKRDRILRELSTAGDRVQRLRAEADAIEARKIMPLIHEGSEAGISLRDLGAPLGVSHVTVMRMLERTSG